MKTFLKRVHISLFMRFNLQSFDFMGNIFQRDGRIENIDVSSEGPSSNRREVSILLYFQVYLNGSFVFIVPT